MKGSYVIIAELDRGRSIPVGSLGTLLFPVGFYAYVGSAIGKLEHRLARHMRRTKKLHWHIDYLLQEAAVTEAVFVESETRYECAIAQELGAQGLAPVANFGCSDCNCGSHLYYARKREVLHLIIIDVFRQLGLSPRRWSSSFGHILDHKEGGIESCR